MSYNPPEQGCSTTEDRMISFNIGTRQILRLTPEGMYFKGSFVEDAGEAHKAFLAMVAEMREHQNKR